MSSDIGLAIQWGLIGDVGLLIDHLHGDNDMVIFGTVAQRLSSCLATMDQLLCQSHAVVTSFISAESNSGKADTTSTTSLRDVVAHILGEVESIAYSC